jgi:sugar diacid utilization regulator
MEVAGQEPVRPAVDPDAMDALVTALRGRQEELVDEGVRRIRAEIGAYARLADPAFVADVREHVALHHEALLRSLAAGRPLERDEMSFIRPRATRRVGRIPLASFLRAFRTYMEVIWDAVLASAVDERSKDTALMAVGIVMRYIDVATTEAAEIYLEGERLQSAQGEGLRRDLVEDLLAGRAPAPGAKLGAARDAGLVDGARLVLVAAAPMGEPGEEQRLRAAASAIARAFASPVEPLTVVRQQEVICIAPARRDPAELAAALSSAQQRLAREGIPLAVGVSADVQGIAGVPEAYGEASAAVERLRPRGGVLAMATLSAFDCLAMFGQQAARRRVPPAIRRFVAEDRADGGVLITTLREYAESDFNVKAAAARLFVHPNTARYRLAKIEERTGLDLRSFADVQELLIAVRVEELAAPGVTGSAPA